MTKEYLEEILTEYGVAFTDSLADRLLREFKPKTGHWIHRKMANEFWEECSECHVERAYPTLYGPDCGAKMVEP